MGRRNRRVAIVLFIPALVPLGIAQREAEPQDPTLAAIVREDGLALPFARFDGRAWAAFHPLDDTVPPPQHDDVPRAWRFHPADGSAPRRLRGGTTVLFNTHGEDWYETWAQVTDYTPVRVGDAFSLPVDRVGLALSGAAAGANVRVVTFGENTARSAPWRRAKPAVAAAFGRAEARLMGQRPTIGSGPWPPRRPLPDSTERAANVVILDRLFVSRGPVAGASLIYVEARKVYRAAVDDPHCPAAVIYAAWFRQRSGTAAPVLAAETAVPGLDCDTAGLARRTVPFGALALGGRTFVVTEQYLWEGSLRQVLEVTATSVAPVFH